MIQIILRATEISRDISDFKENCQKSLTAIVKYLNLTPKCQLAMQCKLIVQQTIFSFKESLAKYLACTKILWNSKSDSAFNKILLLS